MWSAGSGMNTQAPWRVNDYDRRHEVAHVKQTKIMKTRLIWKCSSGVALALFTFVAGCSGQASDAPKDSSPPPMRNWRRTPVPSPRSWHPSQRLRQAKRCCRISIRPVPLAEVIKLAQSGVDESVMLTFVNNSASTFNLDNVTAFSHHR